MHRLLILFALACLAGADDHWVRFSSGPFEVYTDAGPKAGRSTLLRFEEFRYALGQLIGEPDPGTPMPVRILVFRKSDRRLPSEAVLAGRDRYAVLLTESVLPTPALQTSLAQFLLDSNTARMPKPFERGLVDLFSTLEIEGIRITLGRPPAQRTKDWARVHLLATSPDYYGKLRVILYNLRRGVPPEAAYRNAVAKSPAEIEQETERYLAAGVFSTVSVSSRPLAERDFEEQPVEPAEVRLALADLLLPDAPASYQAMIREKSNVPESWEGLGMLALSAGAREEARKDLASAIDAGSKSARCYLEYGRLEPDKSKALTAFQQAGKLNGKLAEPHYLAAQRTEDPLQRMAELKVAATLEPRRIEYWEALAQAYLQQGDFPNAAKAWTAAEQAASTDEERARMRQARGAVEQQRLDFESAERKRAEEEKQRDLARLKVEARAELRALEARANQGAPPAKPGEKVVPWWDGPQPSGHARGTLTQVDCLGRQVRLVIQDADGQTIRLLVSDPSSLAILGGGDRTLGCGPQKPRPVSVEYFPKANSKLATAGEVATIEFQ
jgi:hypothetical protein